MKVIYALPLIAAAGLAYAAAPMTADPKESYARTHDGSAARGAELYQQLGCSACHGDKGEGGPNAPALAGLGKVRPKDEIIASILRPDEAIATGYQRVKVVTTSGKTYSGRLISEDGNSLVLLSGGERKTIRKADVEEMTKLRSAMPDGLLDDASKEDLADLVAYVRQL
jgi:quinoprotein glucose dehydrogenase